LCELGKCGTKNVGRQVLRHIPIAHTAGDERIYAFKVGLVEVGKTLWVFLRRLHQSPLVDVALSIRQSVLQTAASWE
jgi:hypothetical protein